MSTIVKKGLIKKSLVEKFITKHGLMPGTSLPLWTLAYDGISVYGQLDNPWAPTGIDWSIKVSHYSPLDITENRTLVSSDTVNNEFLLPHATNEIRYSFNGGNGDSAAPVYTAQSLHTTKIDSTGDVYVDDIQAINSLQTLTIPSGISYIGRYTTGFYWLGQIHRVELIDNDTPSNSIVINNLIASETQPTDFNIYNELTGQIIGLYFNGVYGLAEGI